MKFLQLSTLLIVSLVLFSGCGGITPKPKEEVVVDTTLPVITLTKRGIITDMNSVAFEWKSIKNDARVEGIYVYKRSPEDENQKELKYYDTIKNRFKTHYVDNNVKPDTRYTYAFKAFSKDAEAKQSQSFDLNTLPVLQSVAWIHSISGMPRSTKIIWRPHSNQRVASYIIERKKLDDKEWNKLVELKGRLHAEYIDEDLDDNQVYMYRVKVKTFDNIISTPSEIVKAVTKPLPKGVSGLKATKNLPKKIKISWSDTTQKDFYRYRLYRSNDVDGKYELIAKLFNNNFTDEINEDGKAYFYRVSVVDKDGLESEYDQNTIMGMTLARPAAPTLLEAKYLGNMIEIAWKANDKRAKSFIVERKYKISWFEEDVQEFKGLKGTVFKDKNIKPDTTYTYVVYSVDVYGIKSKPSIEVSIKTPESNTFVAPKKQNVSTYKAQSVQTTSEKQPQEVIQPIENLDINEI